MNNQIYHPDDCITSLTVKEINLTSINPINRTHLGNLSGIFGINWTKEVARAHPSVDSIFLGSIGSEINIMYESWLVDNQFTPQHSLSYNIDGVWFKIGMDDALNLEDLGWKHFLIKLYVENDLSKFSDNVVVKLQKIILEKL